MGAEGEDMPVQRGGLEEDAAACPAASRLLCFMSQFFAFSLWGGEA